MANRAWALLLSMPKVILKAGNIVFSSFLSSLQNQEYSSDRYHAEEKDNSTVSEGSEMDDTTEGDMGSVRQGKERTRGRSKNQGCLTIIILKEVGKVRTFRISSRLILWASVFFIFYIAATVFVTNNYFEIYSINRMQADKIAALRRELIKTTKSLDRSKQHLALLDEFRREEKINGPEPISTADYTESSSPEIVDINEVKVKRDKSTINVTFRIINRQLNEEPMGGYIFVIASLKDSDQSEVWIYPNSALKEGLPVNYRSGHRFFIQRFISIDSKLRLSKSVDKPLILEILVYDTDGELILKKAAEVQNLS